MQPTLAEIRKAEERAFQVRCGNSPIEISQRNTPALFGAKLIDEMPDQVILANERFQKMRRSAIRAARGRACLSNTPLQLLARWPYRQVRLESAEP